MDKPSRLVAVIYLQKGGFVARIMPPGITCFSDNLDGLRQEIESALAQYSADIDLMADDGAAGYARSAEESDWGDLTDAGNVFYWDGGDEVNH